MREFTTAAEESKDIAEMLPSAAPISFRINDREITAHPPTNSGPFAYFIAMQADDAEVTSSAYASLQFMTSLLDKEDAIWVRNALSVGDLDYSTVGDVLAWLLEQWTARPTTPPRGSSSRRRTTGRALMASAPSEG